MVQVWVTSSVLIESPKSLISPGFLFAPRGARMASRAEQAVSRSFRVILADLPTGGNIPDSEQLRWVLSGLEWFLPEILAEVYPEWERRGLDGIHPALARKIGD
jgi:hypothetical protein